MKSIFASLWAVIKWAGETILMDTTAIVKATEDRQVLGYLLFMLMYTQIALIVLCLMYFWIDGHNPYVQMLFWFSFISQRTILDYVEHTNSRSNKTEAMKTASRTDDPAYIERAAEFIKQKRAEYQVDNMYQPAKREGNHDDVKPPVSP